MKKPKSRTRRNFIKQSTLAGSALIFPVNRLTESLLEIKNDVPQHLNVHLFSKHLQFLDYNDMSEAAAEMGFSGLDLTVRPEGHVLPHRVLEDLPMAVEAMKKGAYDYILKPFKVDAVMRVVERGLERQRLQAENIQLREALTIYRVSEAIATWLRPLCLAR